MKAWIPFTLMIAIGSAAHADGSCNYPRSPDATPDGATATKEQMIAAKHDFDRYNTEMNAYLDCIKGQIDSTIPKDKSKLKPDEKKKAEDQEKMLAEKHNAAVDELQANVGKFNEQLKIFKAKAATQ